MHSLDFNTVERPVLHLVMRDAARTEIDVEVPTVSEVQLLRSLGAELQQNADADGLYALSARLMSHNRQQMPITGENLHEVYGLDLYDLIAFYTGFAAFVSDITNAKN